MTWLALAFVTACAEATKDLVSKRIMQKASAGLVAWAVVAASAPLLVAAALLSPMPTFGPLFLPAVGTTVILYVVAVFLYMKALQASDLSLTLPMIAFTPAFMLLTGPLVLGEMPTALGIGGVATIVIGAYLLNVKDFRKGALQPIVALAREPGPRYMLAVALIFSVTATTAKLAITESSPLATMGTMYTGSAVILTVVMLARRTVTRGAIARNWRGLVQIGLLVTLSEVCLAFALSLSLAVYVISVKRMSILIGALLGFAVFKERNIGSRLLGAVVMLAGLLLISLSD